MKLSYWDIRRLNLPRTWRTNKIVRVVGNYTPQDVVKVADQVQEYMDHTFLIFSNRIEYFQGETLPINLIPVLQVSTTSQLERKLQDYLDLPTPYYVISIVPDEYVKIPKDAPIDWFFISGHSEKIKQLNFIYGNILASGKPLYVETINGSRQIPAHLNIRDIPQTLVRDITTPVLEAFA
ncbi:MAG: hypothetical protein KGI50_06860 [Patescibacteria group bacterium]|nr:hypothetical protein [Patescibacteria group bacterium]MDE2439343.1 hypothetical protein [Patescibacteria group bacterium]